MGGEGRKLGGREREGEETAEEERETDRQTDRQRQRERAQNCYTSIKIFRLYLLICVPIGYTRVTTLNAIVMTKRRMF